MANEATLITEMSLPISFTVADGAGIEKGTLLKITDPNTVAATSADGDAFVGVAAEEKIASDGNTTLAVYVSGRFVMKDAGAGVTAGDILKVNGANLVATTDEAGAGDRAQHVGQALETAAASDTLKVLVGFK